MPLKMRPTGLGHGVYKDDPRLQRLLRRVVHRSHLSRPAPAPPICAGSGRCTLPASRGPCAPTTARRRWTKPRPSSRRAGSSGRRGRGWRRSPEHSEARSNGIKRRVVRFVRHSMVSNRDGKPKKRAPMTPINPADEFLKHAAECQQMAKATRNPANKGTWNRMAERWLQCAERAKNQKVATRARTPIRRQVEVSSAHY